METSYPSDWLDMSDYLVHFTKNSETKDAYFSIMGILSSQYIRALSSFGLERRAAPNPRKVVCFSEVPLHLLTRLAARRSSYGIGFKKSLLIKRGASPVFHFYAGTPQEKAIKAMVEKDKALKDSPLWEITPFVELPNEGYRFEWEREWRCIGDFYFEPKDVSFLIIPEDSHEAALHFFQDVEEENLGPAYFCPYIDPYWDLEKVNLVLSTI